MQPTRLRPKRPILRAQLAAQNPTPTGPSISFGFGSPPPSAAFKPYALTAAMPPAPSRSRSYGGCWWTETGWYCCTTNTPWPSCIPGGVTTEQRGY